MINPQKYSAILHYLESINQKLKKITDAYIKLQEKLYSKQQEISKLKIINQQLQRQCKSLKEQNIYQISQKTFQQQSILYQNQQQSNDWIKPLSNISFNAAKSDYILDLQQHWDEHSKLLQLERLNSPFYKITKQNANYRYGRQEASKNRRNLIKTCNLISPTKNNQQDSNIKYEQQSPLLLIREEQTIQLKKINSLWQTIDKKVYLNP